MSRVPFVASRPRSGSGISFRMAWRLRRQPARRDDVARELRAGWPGAPLGGIVDVDAVRAEVAVARGRGGHRQQLRAAHGAARALVVAEEEPLVLRRSGRRASRRTGSCFVSGRNLPVSGSRRRLRERVARLEAVALAELEARCRGTALRARLGLHRDDAGGRLAELGVVVLRGDLRLADRLEVRVDDDDAEDRVAVLGAVELVAGAAEVSGRSPSSASSPAGSRWRACCQLSCWVPGVSRMNLVKLRSSTGTSVSCR